MKSLTQLEQHILLAIFHLENNAYLITIRDFLKKNTGKNHAIATIYVPLERLRKLGYLDTIAGGPSPKVGGRSIKYYRLTKAGFRLLSEMKKINDRIWLGFPEGAPHEK
jgi:DNA-binding PadR family transcriptional regulator